MGATHLDCNSYILSFGKESVRLNNKEAIQQMMSILLDNASRYATQDGWVRFAVFRKGRQTVIEVSNSCEPIGAEERERLLDRFYRPDRSRAANTGGSGIGLSIAKATAEGHGGRISVDCPTEGSIRFTVTLQLKRSTKTGSYLVIH